MKKILLSCGVLLSIAVLALVVFYPYFTALADKDFPEGDDPDMPGFLHNEADKEAFMLARAEGIGLKRGYDKDKPVDPKLRQTAIIQMERQQTALANRPESFEKESLLAAWTPIGPAPIPNGAVAGPNPTAASGRVTAIAVHPTNPNIVYVGTAQGGLYRTTDGGVNWTPLMDNAMSLAIGAVTIDLSQPERVFVGTGEANFSFDSFFGVGLYRIDNASSASPTITGPLNTDDRAPHGDIFKGRAISKIASYQYDPGTIYVATAQGVGGIGASNRQDVPLPNRGIYRSNNINTASPTFRQVGVYASGPFVNDMDIRDIVLDPLNTDVMIASVNAPNGRGGLYYSLEHRSPINNTTWTQTFQFNGTTNSQNNAELAIHHTQASQPPTIYAATGNGGGRVLRSIDHKFFVPGATSPTWTSMITNNFCGTQCFYDIAIAVDPTDASRVYLGGVTPNLTFGISTNGASSFIDNNIGLHSDSHVIAVAPSQPSTIYFGSDGGIYKSTNSGVTWISLNNSQFSATQFVSVAVHPTDPNFTIGGTQDNGTNFYQPQGAWIRDDDGDGGYAVIDQNAADTTNVRMYHTYNNGFDRVGYAFKPNTTAAAWTVRGCYREVINGVVTAPRPHNGIPCTDSAVIFYAPLVRGPGNPNPIYFGTDRLYRSVDTGLNHQPVSQQITPNVPISAIGISPQNDNVRIVGQSDGGIWGTTTGADTLRNLNAGGTVPNKYIARAVIDPNNVNTAYVTLSAFGDVNLGEVSVWRTTNLNSVNPTWTAAAGGLPLIPVNAFLVDPTNSNTLYAGTDIGVFISTNAGAAWTPFGTGLPLLAVFDMAITANRALRIATHGRGMWDMPLGGGQPRISINDVAQNEGNNGTTSFNFTVTLSAAVAQAVTVNFATSDGSATAALGDYVANSGTVTFNPNETSKTITVTVNGDTTPEPDENFNVNLTGATNATISRNQGIGTIINDDIGISINDLSLNEGNSGTTAFNFTVGLTVASSQNVTVNYATADGSAVAPGDYASVPVTSLTFLPGETNKLVTVLVNGDTAVEPNENFFVNLSSAVNASITKNQGVGTIVNDDGGPSGISINDVSLNEGNTGTTPFTFTVNVTPPSTQEVTVNYATANGTAVAPGDYTAIPSTLLVFGAGEASKTITVLVNGDTTIEPNETFTVNLSNPSNAVLTRNIGTGTIVNDDGVQPSISINDVSANEGNTGTTPFNFTVTLSAASSQAVSVNYSTANGTALFPIDFNNLPSTLLTFNPGETSKQVTVNVNGDTLIEPDETFFVNLSSPAGATILRGQGTGTILSDDVCTYQISPTSQSFPVGGGSNAVQVTAQTGCAWAAAISTGFAESLLSRKSQNAPSGNLIESLSGSSDSIVLPTSASSVFTNSAPITIPDSGTASPFPSNITVSGMSGTITDLNVRINGLSHTFPDDVAMLLVSPDGTKKFILQSDSGGGTDAVNLTYTFDDQAAIGIPDAGPLPDNNGFVRPSSVNDDDGMPPPAPALPYSQPASAGTATLNGTFGGINPNGMWSLFVIDFFVGDGGSISGGWSLDITTQGGSIVTINSGQSGNGNGTVAYTVGQNSTGVARSATMTIAGQPFTISQAAFAAVAIKGRVKTPGGTNLKNAVVSLQTGGASRVVTTNSFGLFTFDNVTPGQTYTILVSSKKFRFQSQTMLVNTDQTLPDFVGLE